MDNHSILWSSKSTSSISLILLLLLSAVGSAQTYSAEQRLESLHESQNQHFKGLSLKNVGPTIMSGRVSDIEGNPANPQEFFVAYASGGVWYTQNGGLSFKPVFDQQSTLTIGDIAVRWADPIEIWVGTGEVNSSRSSYAGTGVYLSNDTGSNWSHIGLKESHHIGRVILDPKDPNTAYVAVLGHLYTNNQERGVYQTHDKGKSWKRSLFLSDSAGAVDLLMNPDGVLYAAIWERSRKAWHFDGDGIGSGIYQSDNGGADWKKLSIDSLGFPEGPKCGRIGLEWDSKLNRLYAVVDNQDTLPSESDRGWIPVFNALKDSLLQNLIEVNDKAWQSFLDQYGFPDKYDPSTMKAGLQDGSITIQNLRDYMGVNSNEALFDTDVKGAELYCFEDGKWHKTHEEPLEGVFYTYGYYFGQVRVDPHDPARLFILGVPLIYSTDSGKTWNKFDRGHIHADHHDLWLNPSRNGHMISGNDGGLNISFDGGEAWTKTNPIPVGQFYTVAVDGSEPYMIYGGLQDNGVWRGSSRYEASKDWLANGKYPYESIMGGDGMQIAIDTRNNDVVYTGYQFGNYYRIDLSSEDYQYITPEHQLGEQAYRWNWQTPIHLSEHHQDFLYLGSQYFHRSLNRGDSFERMSEDLTHGGKPGNVPYGTLTTIDESPFKFGLIYVGSDDGKVHRTDDLGYNWTDISKGLPERLWVSRVEASHHDEGRLFVGLNGYRNDDFEAYLYSSEDKGASYTRIGAGLTEPVNVVLEDEINPDLLFVGTDRGLFVSLDRGRSFEELNNRALPPSPVHDLVYAPQARQLVIGTHGRSIYTCDISFLQDLDSTQRTKALYADVETDSFTRSDFWGSRRWDWSTNPGPEWKADVWVLESDTLELSLMQAGSNMNSWEIQVYKGINQLSLELEIDPLLFPGTKKNPLPDKAENGSIYPEAGDYQLKIEGKGFEAYFDLSVGLGETMEESKPHPDKRP